ncbi:MAG TPA: UTP--glucose-1-phosphate uridylyltransferase [Candidatus Limnocylindrales bacterium]|nr:UTP--glucose-1-phosphate uridylyltransferase [Candidatus Limnocylindrales bacterium]
MTLPKVRKAVIAAAGFGTRFLPQTKAMPKEMLPIVDKPIIQYIVEELVAAGIEDIVIVTGYHKRSIEDHFDYISGDLRANLEQGNKLQLLEETQKISDLANFVYVRQKGPYGTATPLINVHHLIGNEPFIYVFADDLIVADPNCYTQMIGLYEETGGAILPSIRLTSDVQYDRYGVLGGDLIRPDVLKMSSIVEKPGRAQAPSDFGSVGGYLLTADVFDYLESGQKALSGDQEFYLTDNVIQPMLNDGKLFYGCNIKNSVRYDTGNKLDYLKTVVDFALKNDEIKDEFREYLQRVIQ